MGNKNPGIEQTAGYSKTKAQWISAYGTKTGLPNQLIITSDHWWTVTDGTTQLQNLEWFQFDTSTGSITQYVSSGSNVYTLESGDNSTVFQKLKNLVQEWRIANLSTSGTLGIYDYTGGNKSVLNIAAGCSANTMSLTPGLISFGGAVAIGSSGRLTVTTGTYNALDITDIGLINFQDSSAITLNGFTGEVAGAVIFYGITMTGGATLTINNGSGSATDQAIYTITGGALTKSAIGGAGVFINPSGTTWRVGSL
jgi:hypothetical protein